jgi:single-stranded-DNA-specific exonuclease
VTPGRAAATGPWGVQTPRWQPTPVPAAAALLRGAGFSHRLAALLAQRGLTTPREASDFLAPALDQLHPAAAMAGLPEAVEVLARSRELGSKVVLVGDYDVDGVSATALLQATLRACGIEAQAILPHRLRDGYGLQPEHVDQALARGAAVLLAVDCGSTAVAAVERALAQGLQVVVVDHHRTTEALPAGAVLVNPQQPGCPYPFRHLAAAGLAFKLARALAERCGRELPVAALLRIACLGTIADVVPLVGENRVLAALGLRALSEARSPGLLELFRVARLEAPFAASDIAFRVGPRLNAAGRLGSAEPALELLLTRDRDRARTICRQLEELNARRQGEQVRVVEEALAGLSPAASPPPLLVAWSPEWHRGVVGIAAARLARMLNRPTILLSVDGDCATGSGRSVPGVELFGFLAPWKHEMERFGGHAQAVGLTVRCTRLEALRASWSTAAASWPPELLEPSHAYHLELPPSQVTPQVLAEVERLEPFGEGNPQPLFRVGPLRLAGEPRRFGNGHLRAVAEGPAGDRVQLLGWGWGGCEGKLRGAVDVLGYLERNRLDGSCELRLVDCRAASPAPHHG